MPLEEPAIRDEKQIPLPVLILFWVSAAGLIDAALYEYLRVGWYLALDQKLPEDVSWLNIAFLPMGIGLIKRNPDSRSCFQTLLVLLFLLIVLVAVAEIFNIGITSMEGSGPLGWLLIGLLSLWIVAVLWCFKRYENYFNSPELTPEKRRNEKAIVWLIIITSVFSSLTIIESDYGHEKQIDEIFAVHLEFNVIDSESKQPLEHVIFSLEHTDSQNLSQRFRGRETDGVITDRWSISGFTQEPFNIELSADGYENSELTVTKEYVESARSPIDIQLERLSTSSSEQAKTDKADSE